MKTKTIRQNVQINASPAEVYEALMDSKKHSAFTGAKAVISPRVGGNFNAWEGYATGQNLELVHGKKIVQSWRASDWPQEHFSKATFSLAKSGKGTTLSFSQTGVPADCAEEITQGWIDYYWTPLKAFLEKKK